MWHETELEVNGFSYPARYSDQARERVYLPLLRRLVDIQRAHMGRTVALLAGPPAAGKSTIALLLERFSREVEGCELQCVGLDGFHHTNAYLRSHAIVRDGASVALSQVKGAPESFDAEAFGQALGLLRTQDHVSWPLYDRTLHDPRPDALVVSAPIVVVEGNWLLLDKEPWRSFAKKVDLTVMLRANEADLRERAISRKMRGGVSREDAAAHYERSDGPNIRLVLAHSLPADLTMELDSDGDVVLLADEEPSASVRAGD